MNELATQAANDTNTATDRTAIDAEMKQLTSEIDRIRTTTQFNTQNLLDGNFTKKNLQVGSLSGQTIQISISDMSASSLGLAASDIKVDTNANAGKSMSLIQKAIDSVSTQRSTLGALQNRLEHTINNLDTTSENTSAAESRIVIQIWLMRWYSTARIIFLHRLDSQCLHRLISRHRVYFHYYSKTYDTLSLFADIKQITDCLISAFLLMFED